MLGRLRNVLPGPRPDLRATPPTRRRSGPVARPIAGPSARSAGDLVLLNEARSLGDPGIWAASGASRLWLYTLHYFDWLHEEASPGAASAAELLERWIDENPPGEGVGWEPYPLSRRVVNWIKAELGATPLSEAARHSLAVQARWLSRTIEWHLLGNHLVANAKARSSWACTGRSADWSR